MAKRFSTVFFLLLFLVTGCSTDDREPLVVYSPHGKEILTQYEKAFEQLHPDVDVQWLDMGSATVLDRIRTEQENPQASLWWGAPHSYFSQAQEAGLLEPYEPQWAAAADSGAFDPAHHWYGTFLTPEGIGYNTETVAADEVPTTWDDLIDPKFRDRVLIRYPLESGTMGTIFGALILRQPTVEDGYIWLARLDVNTKTYTADPTQLYLKMARREGDLTPWNLTDIYIQRDNNYPFGFVLPDGEVPVLVDGIALVKNAPNPERAKAFYEFVTTREALLEQATNNYRIPARNDIPADDLPDWIREMNLKPMPLDWSRMAQESPTWMQYWDENIKGRGAAYLAEKGISE